MYYKHDMNLKKTHFILIIDQHNESIYQENNQQVTWWSMWLPAWAVVIGEFEKLSVCCFKWLIITSSICKKKITLKCSALLDCGGTLKATAMLPHMLTNFPSREFFYFFFVIMTNMLFGCWMCASIDWCWGRGTNTLVCVPHSGCDHTNNHPSKVCRLLHLPLQRHAVIKSTSIHRSCQASLPLGRPAVVTPACIYHKSRITRAWFDA